MKVTAIFLKDKQKRINESLKKTISNIYFFVCMLFLVFSFSFFIRSIKLSPKVLSLATNFRASQENNFEVSNLFNIYSLYNKENYILEEEIVTDKIENKNNPLQSQIQIIDNEINVIDKEVFKTKNQEASIIAENDNLQKILIGNTTILNYSSKRDIDFTSIGNVDISLKKSQDKILLYNTHTSETYANSEGYKFEYTGTKRTTDANYNMILIAKELADNLNSKGIKTLQNTTPHDYGTYTSAYAKSRVTVKEALINMGGAKISIDVHRDAMADLEYRPVTEIKGVQVAKLMFVMGVGSDTTKNPYMQDNLKLALKLQMLADKVYPGLFKPMLVRNSVYNQDLNNYSLLVEVGASGNTIEEAKLATRCLTNLLNILYND